METEKYPCTLREFILLGRLGFLELGISQDVVLERLGIPPLFDFSYGGNQIKNCEQSSQWYYHTLELRWDMESLTLTDIIVYPLEDMGLPEPLKAVGYFPLERTVIAEDFQIYLKMADINFIKREYDYLIGKASDKRFQIFIAPNVYVSFFVYEGKSKLQAIWLCRDKRFGKV